jgi:transposase
VRAPAPPRVVDGGHYGPGLFARTVVHKCTDCVPLYRQAQAFGREGLDIARSTLVDLFHRAASLIEPIFNRMLALVATAHVVYADETTLKMQRVKKLGFVWTFATRLFITYLYSPSRSGETPAEVLGDSQGLLVVDGYTGYNNVTTPDKRIRAGCNSHSRRKFVDIDDDGARHVLELYREVFAVERVCKERGVLGTPEHLALRRDRAGPAMEAIKAWCDEHLDDYTPKSKMGAAIRYFRNQWPYLTRFLDHADIEPHNNLSERLLRRIALGRKNYLFVGHEQAGKNLAMLCSMVETCKLHGVNPQEYLADVLLRVQDHPASRLDELLPHRWRELVEDPGEADA